MKNLKRKKGFTIVELVIVIAVIGVLSAILIPTFSGLIAKANKSAEQLSLRNSYAAYAAEAMDEAQEESVVYLSKDASITDNSEVFKLDVASGEWKVVEEHGSYVRVQVNEENAPAYNGYYVYKLAA